MRETMLLVKLDCFLDCLISDYITVGKVLRDDARTRLVFLFELTVAPVSCISRSLSRRKFVKASGASDLD